MTAVPAPQLDSWQRRLVIIAWLTYAAYYLGRSNLSATLPAIEGDLALSKSQLGMFISGFFWAYAVGHLINGQIGDRVSPRWFIFIGLLGTAVLNIIFGLVSIFPLLLLVWTLNGYFQATGWGPILRTLANWLEPDQRRRISTIFGTCFVAGSVVSLLLAGWLTSNFGWRLAFLLPGCLLTLTAGLWLAFVRDTPEEAGHELSHPNKQVKADKSLDLGDIIKSLRSSFHHFWSLGIASVFVGICFVSFIVWLPTYFVEVGQLDVGRAATLTALAPVAGIIGTVIIGAGINRFYAGREASGLMVTLILLAVLFIIFPFLPIQLLVSTLAIMVIGGVAYAVASLTMSTMPFCLGHPDEASSTAGFIGFTFNIGSGLSGIIIGFILLRFNWDTAFFVMGGSAVLGALFVWLTIYRLQNRILASN